MHFYLTIFLDDTQDGFLAQELSRFLAEGIKEDNAVVRTLKVNDLYEKQYANIRLGYWPRNHCSFDLYVHKTNDESGPFPGLRSLANIYRCRKKQDCRLAHKETESNVFEPY